MPLCELAILDLALVCLAPGLIMFGLESLAEYLIEVIVWAILYR